MRDVGRKLADLIEIDFDALDHLVEGFDQIVEFVAGLARGNSKAEVRSADALGGAGDFENGSERTACKNPAHHAANCNDQGEQAHAEQGESVQQLLVVRQRKADRDKKLFRVAVIVVNIELADTVPISVRVLPVQPYGLTGVQHLLNLGRRVGAQSGVGGGFLKRMAGTVGDVNDASDLAADAVLFGVPGIEKPFRVVSSSIVAFDPEVAFHDRPFIVQLVVGLAV